MAINIAQLEVQLTAIGLAETTDALKQVDEAGQEAATGLGGVEEGAKNLGEASRGTVPGLDHINRQFAKIALQATGLNPKIAQLILSLVKFNVILLVATVAIAALIAVYVKLKAEQDKVREAQEKINRALDEEARLIRAQSEAGLETARLQAVALRVDAQEKLNQLLGDANDLIQQELRFINLSFADQEKVLQLRRDIVIQADREKKAQEALDQLHRPAADQRKRAAADRLKIERNAEDALGHQVDLEIEALKAAKTWNAISLEQQGWAFLTLATQGEILKTLNAQVDSGLNRLRQLAKEQAARDQAKKDGIWTQAQETDYQKLLKDNLDLNDNTNRLLSERENTQQRILELQRLLGISTTPEEENAATRAALENLRILKETVGLENANIPALTAMLDKWIAQRDAIIASGRFGQEYFDILEKIQRLAAILHIEVPVVISPEFNTEQLRDQLETNIHQALIEGIGTVMEDTFTEAFARGAHVIPNAIKAMSGSILAALGGMMIEQGKVLIGYGKIMTALAKLLSNPFTAGPAAFAAGVALIALGAAFRGIASNMAGGQIRSTVSGRAFDQSNNNRIPDETVRTRIPTGGLELGRATITPNGQIVFNVFGPNDANAQDAIVKALQNAQRRGHSI